MTLLVASQEQIDRLNEEINILKNKLSFAESVLSDSSIDRGCAKCCKDLIDKNLLIVKENKQLKNQIKQALDLLHNELRITDSGKVYAWLVLEVYDILESKQSPIVKSHTKIKYQCLDCGQLLNDDEFLGYHNADHTLRKIEIREAKP